MSEAEVMEAPRASGFLESSCGAGNSAASLDDVYVAKYVDNNLISLFFSNHFLV